MAVDLNVVDRSYAATGTSQNTLKAPKKNDTLDMQSFLMLLASQLQNQDPMNPMKESEFMAQMAQMAMVEAMNTFTDITTTTYAASMVGKEVTMAEVDSDGNMTEVVGVVTGAALYGGEQILFIGEKSYYLNQLMAVGKLPPKEDKPTESVKPTEPETDNKVPEDDKSDGSVVPPGSGDGAAV